MKTLEEYINQLAKQEIIDMENQLKSLQPYFQSLVKLKQEERMWNYRYEYEKTQKLTQQEDFGQWKEEIKKQYPGVSLPMYENLTKQKHQETAEINTLKNMFKGRKGYIEEYYKSAGKENPEDKVNELYNQIFTDGDSYSTTRERYNREMAEIEEGEQETSKINTLKEMFEVYRDSIEEYYESVGKKDSEDKVNELYNQIFTDGDSYLTTKERYNIAMAKIGKSDSEVISRWNKKSGEAEDWKRLPDGTWLNIDTGEIFTKAGMYRETSATKPKIPPPQPSEVSTFFEGGNPYESILGGKKKPITSTRAAHAKFLSNKTLCRRKFAEVFVNEIRDKIFDDGEIKGKYLTEEDDVNFQEIMNQIDDYLTEADTDETFITARTDAESYLQTLENSAGERVIDGSLSWAQFFDLILDEKNVSKLRLSPEEKSDFEELSKIIRDNAEPLINKPTKPPSELFNFDAEFEAIKSPTSPKWFP